MNREPRNGPSVTPVLPVRLTSSPAKSLVVPPVAPSNVVIVFGSLSGE